MKLENRRLGWMLDKKQPEPYCKYIVSTTTQPPNDQEEKATTRLNLRVAPNVKDLLQKAAKVRKYTLTDFIIRASQDAAENVLAEQTRFVLPKEQWAAFNAALDAPPKEIPALKRLFSRKSVFDKP